MSSEYNLIITFTEFNDYLYIHSDYYSPFHYGSYQSGIKLFSYKHVFASYRTASFDHTGRASAIQCAAFSARCIRQNESSRYSHDVRPSVGLLVCPSGTGVHCDHTVHLIADLSLCLDRPMFLAH